MVNEFLYVPTVSKNINELLQGGFERGTITSIMGSGGSGKTNILLTTALNCVKNGGKVAYIDCENGVSSYRIQQIADTLGLQLLKPQIPTDVTDLKKLKIIYDDQFKKILEFKGFNLIHANSFSDMISAIDAVLKMENLDFIVVDSFTYLYVSALCSATARDRLPTLLMLCSFMQSRAQKLHQIASDKGIAVAITMQRVSDVTLLASENVDAKNMLEKAEGNRGYVGGKAIEYSSKVITEIIGTSNPRKMMLIKHRSQETDGKHVLFHVVNGGIVDKI